MNDVQSRVAGVVVFAALTCGAASAVWALPVPTSAVGVDHSATDQIQITQDVYGPLEGMASYARAMADTRDDVVRFWVRYAPLSQERVWAMTNSRGAQRQAPDETALDPEPSLNPLMTAPEPGSMLLLGTGLIGLAGAARRLRVRPERS